MKTRISELIIPTVRATAAAIGCGMLLATTCAAAQNPSLEHGGVHHKHYKVVFTKTFGGPNGHIFIGGAHVLNNSGTLIGSADTSMPDPYAPDGCFNGDDCFATHAFAWHDGEMKDLGAIASYANSETTWIARMD